MAELGPVPDDPSPLWYNVREYGATGDGVTDDTAAIQAAIDAAGDGGRTWAPPGVYKCLTGLTTPLFSTLEGSTAEHGVGGTAATELRFPGFTGSQVGITLGNSATLRHLVIRGPGTATGTNPTGLAGATGRVDNCTFASWKDGTRLTDAYYAQFHQVGWQRCATGLTLVDCYNVNLYGPRIFAGDDAGTGYGVGIDTGTVRALNIFGGSIESFGGSGGIRVSGGGSGVNLYGVYFESSVTAANGIGVESSISDGNQITATGCTVYLTNLQRWINLGSTTGYTLKGSGNQFFCSAASSGTPFAHIVAAGRDVELSGDNWTGCAGSPASYVGGILNGGAVVGVDVAPPIGAGFDAVHHLARSVALPDGRDIIFRSTTGSKIGSDAAQKLAFYGAAPVARPAGVADAAGGAIIDVEARAAVNALISRIETLGLIATL